MKWHCDAVRSESTQNIFTAEDSVVFSGGEIQSINNFY
jgi:hypothetical protein